MSIKDELFKQCLAVIEQNIATTQKSIVDITESMHGETKSSAGDKFETSRAMLQSELDRMTGVQLKSKELKNMLCSIKFTESKLAMIGSLVGSTKMNFFISVGLGKFVFDNTSYFAISPQSPVGQAIIGKQVGDSFVVNGNSDTIISII